MGQKLGSGLVAAWLLLAALPLLAQHAGPNDAPVVDPVAAAAGQTLFAARCQSCHGPIARGTDRGPDLIRSLVVIKDRYGSTLGPFLQKHPQAGVALTSAQVLDLSNFLHQEFYATLSRSAPRVAPANFISGNTQAGEAWFNGAGGCSGCHSATGDLAGIATKLNPYELQQRFMFPFGFHRGEKVPPTTVTVTPPGGATISGALVHLDDFTITLRDAQGQIQNITRVPGMTIDEHNPLAAHVKLVKTITDQQMHDMTAYLETLK